MLFQPLHSEVARQLRREFARDLERRFRVREAGAAALGLRAAHARESAPAPSRPAAQPAAEHSESGARR